MGKTINHREKWAQFKVKLTVLVDIRKFILEEHAFDKQYGIMKE